MGVSEWGSCNFMHSRGEVCSFLQSAAHYWLCLLYTSTAGRNWMKEYYKITEVARLYGLCTDTLRYYEEQRCV